MGLRFQHPAPVQPGALGNIGWREEENLARQGLEAAAAAPAAAAVVAAPAKAAAADGSVAMFTMEEVEQHASEESAWFVYEGKVYDATPFLDEHPGGAESILISAGVFMCVRERGAERMISWCFDRVGSMLVQAEPRELLKQVHRQTAPCSLAEHCTSMC